MHRFSGKRIALITNIPRPYRVPLYEVLNQEIRANGGELRVFFYSNVRKHLRRKGSEVEGGKYPHTFLTSLEFSLSQERLISFPISLFSALRHFQPHILISGAFGIPGCLAWLYTRQSGIPYVQWSGATLQRDGQGGQASAMTQRFLARRASASLAYGTAAREYLVQAGACAEHVVVGVNAVDIAFFIEKARDAMDEVAHFKKNNFLDGVNFLYVGNLFPLKGVSYLLTALSKLRTQNSFHFHLVGDGPEREPLTQQAQALGLLDRVHFWGAQPPGKVPFYYALADVFVFPSLYDVWGLVLNEAMACGLPVIASPIAGATRDLVIHGENGFVVDPRHTDEFAGYLQQLLENPDLRTRMGQQAAATIQAKATIQHSVNAFMQAIQLAMNTPVH